MFVVLNRLLFALAVVLTSFVFTTPTEAASVYNCSASGKKCVAKVEQGIIGDRVRVLDEKARVVAHGRIVKRRGAYAIIAVSRKSKHIRKGYPVIVDMDSRSSNLQWAASFSNRD